MIKLNALVWLIFGSMFFAGCSDTTTITTTISTGMKMHDATQLMSDRGLSPSEMGYSEPNKAYDLPDGRCVVLFGDTEVDGIEVILNPDRPKSERESQTVEQIQF